jgi:hypothetical protein
LHWYLAKIVTVVVPVMFVFRQGMPCLYGGGDCIEGGDRDSSWTCSHDHLLITATDIQGNEISIRCRYGMITEVVSAFVKDRRGGGFGNVVSKKRAASMRQPFFSGNV